VKIAERNFTAVLKVLKKNGILLQSDALLPSVASLIAGEPVRGSWWTHPQAQEIFVTLNKLEDHKDVLFTKLISGKVTLVHRSLWNSLVPIATSHESWQMRGLSPAAKFLLLKLDAEEAFASNELDWPAKFKSNKLGDVVRDLEGRLLVHTEEFHTESGAHAKLLEDWQHWIERIGFREKLNSPVEAKRRFEGLLDELNKVHGAKARLPWQGK
jgi:hypothetical protein